jgi:hypothetical protein
MKLLLIAAYFEVELVNRLQSVIEKQRSQIKKLDQSVLDVKTENDEVCDALSRLLCVFNCQESIVFAAQAQQ